MAEKNVFSEMADKLIHLAKLKLMTEYLLFLRFLHKLQIIDEI